MKDCIYVPKCVFPIYHSKRHLYPDELYLYSLLYRWRIEYDHMAIFNIDGISELCPYKFMAIKPNGDASRNKARIKELINNLHVLKYVQIGDGLDLRKVGNNNLLLIKFKNEGRDGLYIPYEIFDHFKNPLEFYIYAYIDMHDEGTNNSEGCAISYKEWSHLTGYSHDKIEAVVKKMNSYQYTPRIWKFSGDYYKENKDVMQRENVYFTRPSFEIKNKWHRFYGEL